MTDTTPITVAFGDGIGPEIMNATLLLLKEAGAKIRIDAVEIGERAHKHGFLSGVPDSCWEIIRKNKVMLKAPITTPQGGGYKSVNVTLRRGLGLYANIRPCRSYHPFVNTKHPKMDMVIIRENEEGLYVGIEHRQCQNVTQSLKLISRQGCERIIQYAYDYAQLHNRTHVTCLSKDNILKITDGLFHNIFKEAATHYPNIKSDHLIVDIGMARLANAPEKFDVVVTGNLYGDILSDIVSEISGSVGLSGSANIGPDCAMFEAIHGSAPDIADQGIANPSGLFNAAVMMLVHIGQVEPAERISNAWLKTLEDGIHTGDIYHPDTSKQKVGTQEFTRAVIARLGQKPGFFAPASFGQEVSHKALPRIPFVLQKETKQLAGMDVFFDWTDGNSQQLAEILHGLTAGTTLKLQMLSSRGLKVWPLEPRQAPASYDYWCARFFPEGMTKSCSHAAIVELLAALQARGLDFLKTENLYLFNGEPGFSLAQGE